MAKFCLKDSDEYYLCLSEQPKRFDADSPVTNVFFDDTNGQVFTVRSGGVTGVTVNGMDDSKSTSFRMEDRGPIISIKFSPDHNVLAIQRNRDNQNATVEFVNFENLAPTKIEYSHTCKWKNAKILGFVWPKTNEIAFITDYGIELLQVFPEKKQLKSLKSTSFSGAWFSWCSQSKIVLLAGNNGLLLQPFSLNNSSITKLQKLELESGCGPVLERDVVSVRACGASWCAVFRHTQPHTPTEVWLMPVTGANSSQYTHILKTGLVGRFAINVIDDLIIVHHQSSQTSQVFDIVEESKPENNTVVHIPVIAGCSIRPATVADQLCPMYSGNWVVFQPDYIIDARLGCLWRVHLQPPGLAHSIPKEEVAKIVSVLLRRTDGKATIYRILNQLVDEACKYLVQLSQAFDEVNSVYRKWADSEMARNTAGSTAGVILSPRVLISQPDMCTHVLQNHHDNKYIVQVVTSYVASVCRADMVVQHAVAELCVRTLVGRGGGGGGRLRALVRRGALGEARPLACQLLSCGHLEPACAQLALDMMWRLRGYEEVVEVLLSWNEPISAVGAAKQAGTNVWHAIPSRKLLAAAKLYAEQRNEPTAFVAIYHALLARNERIRGSPHFTKGEQCDSYVEYYKKITSE